MQYSQNRITSCHWSYRWNTTWRGTIWRGTTWRRAIIWFRCWIICFCWNRNPATINETPRLCAFIIECDRDLSTIFIIINICDTQVIISDCIEIVLKYEKQLSRCYWFLKGIPLTWHIFSSSYMSFSFSDIVFKYNRLFITSVPFVLRISQFPFILISVIWSQPKTNWLWCSDKKWSWMRTFGVCRALIRLIIDSIKNPPRAKLIAEL